MTEYTPGPWEVIRKSGSLPETSAWMVGRRGDISREETLICEMPFFATRGDLAREYQANAKLVAAAPQMLEALKMVRRIIGQDQATMEEQTAVLKAMRHAIAAAEGKETEE